MDSFRRQSNSLEEELECDPADQADYYYLGGESGDTTASRSVLFDGKTPRKNASCFSRVFFFWLNPLVKFTQNNDVLNLENYGILEEKNEVAHQIEKLRSFWEARRANEMGKNGLVYTIFACYKWDLAYLIFCNFCSVCLVFTQPVFLNYLIEYIKDGENRLCKYGINFYDFGDYNGLEWLTE